MIYISHRGNLNGPDKERENSPSYIMEALDRGFHVEVDVWFVNGEFWLGHDEPQYKTDYKLLVNEKLWCHAKNLSAILEMKKYVIHYFWHENDRISLTSKNYVWAYPGNQPIIGSIAVLPELYNDDISQCKGICSDFIERHSKS
jgi:hypothetical protein